MDLSHLPGGDLVAKGLEDLARARETVEALLVSIAATRLRRRSRARLTSDPASFRRRLEEVLEARPRGAS